MKKYIWFNPVVLSFYKEEQLSAFVHRNDLTPVTCSQNWIAIVKDKYKEVLKQSDSTVLDMRCPKAVRYIKENYETNSYTLPAIEPILIHCARELQATYALPESELLITTPCEDLAAHGNSLHLKNTRFLTFSRLLEETYEHLVANSVDASPIPPGFFHDIHPGSRCISGQENLDQIFAKPECLNDTILELLYCDCGCHNGDGLIM